MDHEQAERLEAQLRHIADIATAPRTPIAECIAAVAAAVRRIDWMFAAHASPLDVEDASPKAHEGPAHRWAL